MDLFFFGGGFEILFSLAFFAVLAVILVTAVRGLLQWNQNNHSPRLTVPAVGEAHRHHALPPQYRRRGARHLQHHLLRHVPGGKRRPHGTAPFGRGIRHAGRGRPRQAHLSGHTLSFL